jgi:RimJ/RimL family protein N-acetyltransferase
MNAPRPSRFNENSSGSDLTLIDSITERKGGSPRTLQLFRGHTPELVTQLIEKSKQPHIADPLNCPRDSAERFVSHESFEKWRQKNGGRTTYFLADETGDLAGLVWFGAEAAPDAVRTGSPNDPACTFAIRMYEGYDGKGSAQEFIESSLQDFVGQLPADQVDVIASGIHLETNVANLGAQHLYEKVGWQEVHRADSSDIEPAKQRVVMVLPPHKITEIYDKQK